MVLVDTSVWIEHFRSGVAELEDFLESFEVLTHPFIIGELACGNLKNRREILNLLQVLPPVHKVDDKELLFFIDLHSLSGRGIGLVDMHFLACAHLESCSLWTLDKKLNAAAEKLNLRKMIRN